MRWRLATTLGLSALLAGCSGWQNALDTASPDAGHIAWLFWLFVAVTGAVWVCVMLAVALALSIRNRAPDDPLSSDRAGDHRRAVLIGGLVLGTLAIVLVLTGLSYVGQRRIYGPKDEAVTIRITGHQWWWEATYEDPDPSRTFTTANEIHIPVGQQVNVKLNSSDVIHSFWVPSLTGKMDAITGRENQIHLQAERPGIYRGQCAEFCGLQHAHMGLLVVAEDSNVFERWRNGQLAPADHPSDGERRQGEAVFVSQACMMCHSVRGTQAAGRTAPDLTHIGSRRYIASGVLPMSRGNLAGWIADPHGIKPGVDMPMVALAPSDLTAVSAYLVGLK